MGDLVTDHVEAVLQLALAGLLRVDDQVGVAVGDQTDVLHGSSGEVRDCYVVQLVAWVRNPVVVGEVLEAEDGVLHGDFGEVEVAPRDDHPYRRAADHPRLGGLEWPGYERQQVRGHLHRGCESELDPAILESGPFQLPRVRICLLAGGNNHGRLERGLEVRLIPTGDDPAGVRRLTLGCCDQVLVALGVPIHGLIQTLELIVDRA